VERNNLFPPGVSQGFEIVFDREEDGRWIAEIESLPGVLAYGATELEAQSKVERWRFGS